MMIIIMIVGSRTALTKGPTSPTILKPFELGRAAIFQHAYAKLRHIIDSRFAPIQIGLIIKKFETIQIISASKNQKFEKIEVRKPKR